MGLEFKFLDQLGGWKIQADRSKKPWFSRLFKVCFAFIRNPELVFFPLQITQIVQNERKEFYEREAEQSR